MSSLLKKIQILTCVLSLLVDDKQIEDEGVKHISIKKNTVRVTTLNLGESTTIKE